VTAAAAVEEHWIREFENGAEYIEHLDGVPWYEAGVPGRWHRCKPRTRGLLHRPVTRRASEPALDYVERCACGATRLDRVSPWMEKNQTRKARRRRR
jgi:hypothetical protein